MSPARDLNASSSPLLYLDDIQADLYRLLSLFYSGVGIIQRDAPGDTEDSSPGQGPALEHTIQELSREFVAVKTQLRQRIAALENRPREEPPLAALLQETRELDQVLQAKVAAFEQELPWFKEHVAQLINRSANL